MITAEQIKAARALLNWKQSDLARESGVSLPSINNIERNIGSPRLDTLQSIQTALRNCGIEFIGMDGVTRHKEIFEIREHHGEDFVRRMNDDLFSCMKGPNDIVYILGLDDRKYAAYSADEMLRYDEHHKKTNFTHKVLVKETETFFLSPIESYRLIAPELLGTIPHMVYKDRMALMMWEAQRGIIIRSQSIADTFLRQFEFLWDMARPLSASAINLLDDPKYLKKALETRAEEQKDKKRRPVKW